jgi:hypothetical protein
MDRANADELTRRGGTPGHQDAALPGIGVGQAHPPEEKREQRGRIATVVKGALKIYLVPATRARDALASVTEGWSDLVAEARQEHEARKQTDVFKRADAEPAVAASPSTAPVAEPEEPQHSIPGPTTTPRKPRKPRAPRARAGHVADRPERTQGVTETSPSLPGPAETEAPADVVTEAAETPTPTPTLVETGESQVEVRPNPSISPPHVTSGVSGHIPPEVRHKLAGDGPIRA